MRFVLVACLLSIPCWGKCFLSRYFENNFIDFPVSGEEQVRRDGSDRHFTRSKDTVWRATMGLLLQKGIVVHAARDTGLITYVEVDHMLDGESFVGLKLPFTLLIEAQTDGTTVYVYPMVELLEKELNKKDSTLVKAGFVRKRQELLYQIATELEAPRRWPWLRK